MKRAAFTPFLFALAIVMAFSVSLIACGSSSSSSSNNSDDDSSPGMGDDDASPGMGDDDASPAAEIRVIHLSPDAPAVDVYVDSSTKAFTDLAFGKSTDFAKLPAGSYNFEVTATGSPVSSAVLTVNGLDLAAGSMYTAVAYDFLASPIKALALADNFSGLKSGDIRVRAIHTASGVGAVDIWLLPTSGSPSILWKGLDFGVAGAYLDIPAGAYTIGFDLNGDGTPELTFDIPSLPAGTIANVFAVNDGASVFLIAQLQDGSTVKIPSVQSATVFAPHAPDGSTVAHVDLNRYVGKWYEIATIPIIFQAGCTGSTATYTAVSSTEVAVLNDCRLGSLDGRDYTVSGKARVVDAVTDAKLSVAFDFFPIVGAPYWVIELDGSNTGQSYEWAVVGGPTKDFLWILSRTPRMEQARLAAILQRVIDRGYDIHRLSFTKQPSR